MAKFLISLVNDRLILIDDQHRHDALGRLPGHPGLPDHLGLLAYTALMDEAGSI